MYCQLPGAEGRSFGLACIPVSPPCTGSCVHGGWSGWTEYTTCSVASGIGKRVRTRTCTNPAPAGGGNDCPGSDYDVMECAGDVCNAIVDFEWSAWSDYTACSATCGPGVMTRTRICTCTTTGNPADNATESCGGDSEERTDCSTTPLPCPQHGGWSSWANWTSCPVTCGGGQLFRTRECTNPAPAFGGDDCIGNSHETANCAIADCPTMTSDGDGDTSLTSREIIILSTLLPLVVILLVTLAVFVTLWRGAKKAAAAVTPSIGIRQGPSTASPLASPIPPQAAGGSDYNPALEKHFQEKYMKKPPPVRQQPWTTPFLHRRLVGAIIILFVTLWRGAKKAAAAVTPSIGIRQGPSTAMDNPIPPQAAGGSDYNPDCLEGFWTGWFDRDDPSETGDWEMLTYLRRENVGQICSAPTAVHARVISTHVEATLTGENWQRYDTTTGFICRIEDQDDGACLDYEVRFCCPPRVTDVAMRSEAARSLRGIDAGTAVPHVNQCREHGGWSGWTEYTTCSAATGTGKRVRTRTCTNPAPAGGGNDCPGSDYDVLECLGDVCNVDFQWSAWSDHTACSATCGAGVRTRTRTCTCITTGNPADNATESCGGDSEQRSDCSPAPPPCPQHGGWSSWANWTSCPVTCGGGQLFRTRECTDPAPAHGGDDCIGNSHETANCAIADCPTMTSDGDGDTSLTSREIIILSTLLPLVVILLVTLAVIVTLWRGAKKAAAAVTPSIGIRQGPSTAMDNPIPPQLQATGRRDYNPGLEKHFQEKYMKKPPRILLKDL
ncbi:hypothetical protein Bbelb_170670 [Branchiostoma belcheri]|nr:hypothetical protein Bbelb_170670 [Branchiostoma belcheri]